MTTEPTSACVDRRDPDNPDELVDSAEGFAAWLEGCGYPPPAGALSWAEMLHGYRAYVREWAAPEHRSRAE